MERESRSRGGKNHIGSEAERAKGKLEHSGIFPLQLRNLTIPKIWVGVPEFYPHGYASFWAWVPYPHDPGFCYRLRNIIRDLQLQANRHKFFEHQQCTVGVDDFS